MAISKAILLKCLNPCTFFAPGTVGAAVEANGCRNYFMNKLAHNLVIIYICNWNIMHAYMYVLLTWLAQWPWLRINLKPIWPGNLNTSDRGLHHNDRRLGGIGRVVPIGRTTGKLNCRCHLLSLGAILVNLPNSNFILYSTHFINIVANIPVMFFLVNISVNK